jgi:hypothetical protein
MRPREPTRRRSSREAGPAAMSLASAQLGDPFDLSVHV